MAAMAEEGASGLPEPGELSSGSAPTRFDRRRTDRDATRRTHLANERTYLAWWRSGLTAYAVSVGVGRVVPELADTARWPYAIAGVGFALLGTFFVGYGAHRQRAVEESLTRGEFSPPDRTVLVVLATTGIALGLLTLVLVLVRG
jgi:putative membrane protein